MKVERVWFNGADPIRKTEIVARGEPAFAFFGDGHVEIFVPVDGGPSGYNVTLSREEAEKLE